MVDEGFEDFDYDPFDWSGYDDYDDNTDDDNSEGGLSVDVETASVEAPESANAEASVSEDSTATTAEQEANTNDIQSSEAEQELGEPADFSWISTSDLSAEDKDDKEIKAETKEETKTEAKSEFPNGMTKEEFNAMYEFALGMTGKGGNQQVNDYGEPTGYWGDFETIPTSIEEIQHEIDKLESRIETANDETVKTNAEAKLSEERENLAAAQTQLEVLSSFLDNYSNLYTPIEQEEQKELAVTAASKAVEQARQEQHTAWNNLTNALVKAGIDPNMSAEDVLKAGGKVELSKDNKNYAIKAAEEIARNFTNRGFKGGSFTIPVDTAAKENGSYLVKIAPAAGIGVSNFNVAMISPEGEYVMVGNISSPSGWGNGGWDLKDRDGKTISKGESTSGFLSSITKAMSEAAIADYENSMTSSSIPEDVKEAANAVVAADKNVEDKEKELEKAHATDRADTHKSATEAKQDIMDKYARGELNPYQAAVALSNINDSMLDFNYNSITSNINYDDFKDKAAPVAGVTNGTVGISDLVADLSPVNPSTSSKNETNISKEITKEFKSLNEVKEALTSIDTTKATDLSSFNDMKTQVEAANTQLDTLASSTYLQTAKSLLEKGVSLAELDKQPEIQALNNEIYAIAQMVLDKASELKEISGQYGLNNLSYRDIKGHGKNDVSRGYYSAQVALMTGKNGVQLLDKQEMKALAKYSKTLDATIDSAKALMTAAAVLHGAQDVKGGKYAQAWKSEAAEQKLTAKEWFATAATSTLGLFATILGFGMMPVNPVVGGALAYAGTKEIVETTAKTIGKETTAHLTNYERMFGSQDKKGASVIANIYDRGFNRANYGDAKSVGTYTSLAGSTIDAINAMTMLTNPVTAMAGLGMLYKSGKAMSYDLARGSYSGKQSNLLTNVWRLTTNIEEWANTNLDSDQLAELMNAANDFTEIESIARERPDIAESAYGSVDDAEAESAEGKYSGYAENAKNANLAKDYNAGMEQDVNEAVSDKKVKGYIVKIYNSEPDFIRNAISKILAAHSEREWK